MRAIGVIWVLPRQRPIVCLQAAFIFMMFAQLITTAPLDPPYHWGVLLAHIMLKKDKLLAVIVPPDTIA